MKTDLRVPFVPVSGPRSRDVITVQGQTVMEGRIKAIGLVSGGLDSTLAVAVLKRQGIEMLGIHFLNGFSSGMLQRLALARDEERERQAQTAQELSEILGIPVEVIDVSEEYLGLLLAPRHGYGANVNPCIDCRIFMLKKAKVRMEREGAHFIFTGEVLGQRPMSQHRQAMELVERRSGLKDLLVRPLCAKLLKPSLPEREGWVRREELLDIQGRSRRRQIELAAGLGITDYAQPAGGCTLTDDNYARRFRDLVGSREPPSVTREETVLLSIGRHLRINRNVKIVVGRDKGENMYLERYWSDSPLATTIDYPGPTTLIQGDPSGEDIVLAASITARYSDAKRQPQVRVVVRKDGTEEILTVIPAGDDEIGRYRI
ncbi:MAG: hypothetical protein JSV33_01435 [bacterium]|nr:MAG: hypothetical protein JSV33_01435 [bacterium]